MDQPRSKPPPDPDRILRAAEIALRLADEHPAAIPNDPELVEAVARWEQAFAQLADELVPIEPAPRVLASLEDKLGARAAPAGERIPTVSWWRGVLDSLTFWRGLAGAGFVTAALVLVLFARTPGAEPPAPVLTGRTLLVSSLMPKEGSPLFVAAYDATRATLLIVPAAIRRGANGTPFLWLVPDDSGEPVALGLLDPDRPVALAVSAERARQIDGQAGLVITLEPSGEPSDSARGPVIAHGRFLSL